MIDRVWADTMWFAGIISLIQVGYLPGAVLFRYLRLRGLNPLEQITGIFASSLIANYLLVTLFVTLHIHTSPAWWTLIAAEAGYLIATRRRSEEHWTLDLGRIGEWRKLSFESSIALILFFAGLMIMVNLVYRNWGSVYVGNDDVANWDRWAEEWSANQFPSSTSIYPQLLPSNASISYVLLGTTDVKMFSKAFTPVYSVLPILLFLSLAIRRRNASYLIGGALYAWILFHYLGPDFLQYGYADVPLAFFGFLTFYCVYRSPDGPDRNEVMAGLIAAVGTLLTKQPGGYVLLVMALYAYYWKSKQARRSPSRVEEARVLVPAAVATNPPRPQSRKAQVRGRTSVAEQKAPAEILVTAQPVPARLFQRDKSTELFFLLAAVCALWYIVKFVEIGLGIEYQNIGVLTQALHHGRGYGERILATWHMFLTNRDYTAPVSTSAIALLVVGSLLFKQTRAITLYVLLPFLAIYSLFFSYEIRTASLGFPLVALVCGETLHQLLSFVPRFPIAARFGNRLAISAAVTACIAAWALDGEVGRDLLPPSVNSFLTNPWIVQATYYYAHWCFFVAVLCLIVLLAVRIETGSIEIGRLAILTGIVLMLFGAQSRATLLAGQMQLARIMIGDAEVNAKLYETIAQRNITTPIVTDYWFLRALPGIGRLFRHTPCGPCSLRELRASVASERDGGFILMWEGDITPEAHQAIDRPGEFTTLFVVNGMRFIQVNRSSR